MHATEYLRAQICWQLFFPSNLRNLLTDVINCLEELWVQLNKQIYIVVLFEENVENARAFIIWKLFKFFDHDDDRVENLK